MLTEYTLLEEGSSSCSSTSAPDESGLWAAPSLRLLFLRPARCWQRSHWPFSTKEPEKQLQPFGLPRLQRLVQVALVLALLLAVTSAAAVGAISSLLSASYQLAESDGSWGSALGSAGTVPSELAGENGGVKIQGSAVQLLQKSNEADTLGIFEHSAWWQFIGELASIIVVVVIIGWCLLNASLKFLIERLDRIVLSVDVHMTRFRLGFSFSYFIIEGFRMDNPPGWDSEYLLKADRIEVAVNWMSVILSLGDRCELYRLQVTNLEINYEHRSGSLTNDNIQPILDFLEGVKINPLDPSQREKTKKLTEYILHEVSINKIVTRVHLPPPMSKMELIPIHDINFLDLAQQQTTWMIQDLMRFIMSSILKSATSGTSDVVEKARMSLGTMVDSAKKSVQEMAQQVEVAREGWEGEVRSTLQTLEERAKDAAASAAASFEHNVEELSHKWGEVLHNVFHQDSERSPERRQKELEEVKERAAPGLSALRLALLQTGLRPAALCPDGVTREHLAMLATLVAIDQGECSFDHLFLVLAQGHPKMSPRDFASWLESR